LRPAGALPSRYNVGMSTKSPVENEIKLRAGDPRDARARIEAAGFTVSKPRLFETNAIFDTAGRTLRAKSQLLRLRRAADRWILTFKGEPRPGPHKNREEIETGIADGAAAERILARLGFEPGFHYEKYRTEYSRASSAGTVTLDETPIGTFVELEGPPGWVDETARELGYAPADYITKSYGTLYFEYCRQHGADPADMIFEGPLK
jgi:adenylate cyclase, class 2